MTDDSIHCLILEILDEKVVIINFPGVFFISFSKDSPIALSERVNPGVSAPRQSENRHKTPSEDNLLIA